MFMSNAVAAPSTHSIKDLLALVAAMEPGTRRLLTGVTWNEYLHLNDSSVDPPNLRMSFIEGTLEIMALGLPHEKYSRFLSALLRILADELELDLEEVGSTTLRLEPLQTGAEPDTAVYCQHAAEMIGRDKIELGNDPPPDIVIEIDLTHPSYSKRPIYARFGVPEIWLFKNQQVEILELVQGEYRPPSTSLAFPFLQANDLTAFIEQSIVEGQSKTLRDFRARVKAHKPEKTN
jgi:Uma2 family endonuclease